MDYEHTMQLYDQAKQKKQFLETAEYLDYKKELKWLETVRSKRTGTLDLAQSPGVSHISPPLPEPLE